MAKSSLIKLTIVFVGLILLLATMWVACGLSPTRTPVLPMVTPSPTPGATLTPKATANLTLTRTPTETNASQAKAIPRGYCDLDRDGDCDGEDLELFFTSTVDGREPCDLDSDGDCDRKDHELYMKAEHMCFDHHPRRTLAYNPLADADRDGCVTPRDRNLLFPVAPER